MNDRQFLVHGILGALTIFMFMSRSCMAACPAKSDVVPFDISAMAGRWLMLAGTPTSGTTVSKCCQFIINETSPNTIHVNFTAISRRTHEHVTFTANVTVGEEAIGTWQLQGSKRVLGPLRHRLISVENDTAVMVVCGDDDKDIAHHEFSLILARDLSVSPRKLNQLKENLHPYFDSDKIVNVDHSTC